MPVAGAGKAVGTVLLGLALVALGWGERGRRRGLEMRRKRRGSRRVVGARVAAWISLGIEEWAVAVVVLVVLKKVVRRALAAEVIRAGLLFRA